MRTLAIILASGRGSRMGKLTKNLPKGLLKINNTSPVLHQMNNISRSNIDELIITTGYCSEKYEKLNVKTIFNKNWSSTNMVSSLMLCNDEILKFDSVIISYSDVFFEEKALNSIMSTDADICLTYDINWKNLWKQRFSDPLVDAESFRVDKQGCLIEIGNKIDHIDNAKGQFMGLFRFTKIGWKNYYDYLSEKSSEDVKKMDITTSFKLLIEETPNSIKCLPFDGIWGEIDSEKDVTLYRANKLI